MDVPELPSLLRALTYLTGTYPGFLGDGAPGRLVDPVGELSSVLYDARRAGSLASTVDALFRVAGRVRDRLSTDMWRILSGLALSRPNVDSTPFDRDPFAFASLTESLDLLDRRVITLAAFGGLVTEGMTRGQGWRFLDMGRRLERSLHTLGLLRVTLAGATRGAPEGPLLDALLEIADSAMTFRRRYLGSLQAAPVLDLLLADEDNPRSLAFQFASVAAATEALPRSGAEPGERQEWRLMNDALERIRTADIGRLAEPDSQGRRAGLEAFLAGLEADLPKISDVLTGTYLTHLQASRQYASRSA
jgi:uncharacterized alpha-E superfamily protein